MAALLFDLWCVCPGLHAFDSSSPWPWAVLTGDIWDNHGKVVAHATRYLPTSFGRMPQNPQEKISSSYKAWEFLYYLYGEGPGIFFNILPALISQEQLVLAHRLLLEWCNEFEELYYQRNPDRLHFVHQCVHSLTHLAKETHRLGPLSLSSQWTMERVIGVLSSLLRQPSNPYANLTVQAQKMAHINALVAMWPSFEKAQGNPHGSIDLGDGYLLLGPKEDLGLHFITPEEEEALTILKLPMEQIARSQWRELERCSDMSRTDRNIKIFHQNVICFAEVKYYFVNNFGGTSIALTAVLLYSPADEYIFHLTHGTLCICEHQGEENVVVVNVKSIISVVAMVPFPFIVRGCNNQYFMIEQIGLDVVDTDATVASADDLNAQ
ncbi:hypothetical protein BDM02DRAFT_3156425 [Thelephora ganbajun]|uniref:Uncharacterized protein n=1 Tax=Thelephora ganbajun TaxID=370292 RepID=A0ACB6ZBA6_THEGA|nr:hypothetical protein BDM02DRAFT_3156425 [Thelephora ganbajun]